MAFPSFTSTEACPITIAKSTLLTGGVFSNQALKVGYSVPAAATATGFKCTALFSFSIDDEATCTGDATVLYLYTDWDAAPTGQSRFLRMDDNGDEPPDNFIELVCASGAHGPANVIKTNTISSNCWGKSGVISGQTGYLKCDIGGTTKYIALYVDKA